MDIAGPSGNKTSVNRARSLTTWRAQRHRQVLSSAKHPAIGSGPTLLQFCTNTYIGRYVHTCKNSQIRTPRVPPQSRGGKGGSSPDYVCPSSQRGAVKCLQYGCTCGISAGRHGKVRGAPESPPSQMEFSRFAVPRRSKLRASCTHHPHNNRTRLARFVKSNRPTHRGSLCPHGIGVVRRRNSTIHSSPGSVSNRLPRGRAPAAVSVRHRGRRQHLPFDLSMPLIPKQGTDFVSPNYPVVSSCRADRRLQALLDKPTTLSVLLVRLPTQLWRGAPVLLRRLMGIRTPGE